MAPATARRAGVVAALIVGALALVGSTARAADGEHGGDEEATPPRSSGRPMRFSVSLAGDAARLDPCGGPAALLEEVRGRVRRDVLVAEADADIRFVVTLTGRDGEARAEIVEHDREGLELGRRDVPLPPGDCAKARETLAVVLAILVGPERTVVDEPPPSVAPPPVAPRPKPPPRTPRPPRAALPAATDPLPPWAFTGTAELVGGSGVLPGAAWAIQGAVAVHLPATRFSVMLRGHYWPSRTGGARPSSEVDRLGGSTSLCYAFVRAAPLGLSGCAGFDASRLHARSSDLTQGSETGWVLDVLGEARVGYRVARAGRFLFEPVVAAQVTALVRRDRFLYRDFTGQSRILLQPAPVAFQTSLGLAVHFF